MTLKDLTWHNRTIDVADLHVFNQLMLADKPAMIFGSDLLFEYDLVVDYSNKCIWMKE